MIPRTLIAGTHARPRRSAWHDACRSLRRYRSRAVSWMSCHRITTRGWRPKSLRHLAGLPRFQCLRPKSLADGDCNSVGAGLPPHPRETWRRRQRPPVLGDTTPIVSDQEPGRSRAVPESRTRQRRVRNPHRIRRGCRHIQIGTVSWRPPGAGYLSWCAADGVCNEAPSELKCGRVRSPRRDIVMPCPTCCRSSSYTGGRTRPPACVARARS
jgi:hypothetical protein